MENIFKVLADFLGEDLEVQGRSEQFVDPDLRAEIDKFVRGEMDEEHRAQFCRRVLERSEAMSFLMAQIRKRPDMSMPIQDESEKQV